METGDSAVAGQGLRYVLRYGAGEELGRSGWWLRVRGSRLGRGAVRHVGGGCSHQACEGTLQEPRFGNHWSGLLPLVSSVPTIISGM